MATNPTNPTVTPASTAQVPWHMQGQGVTAYTRQEGQAFARRILQSAAYRQTLEKRAIDGTLPAAVETMLWHYAYGKPPETINVSVQEDLSQLTTEQLRTRTEAALSALREAEAIENALSAVPVSSTVM